LIDGIVVESVMFARKTSISVGLSSSPLAFFSGRTRRMSMISLTLFFIELRILRRRGL
jgi:hypothetical protein